MGGCGEALGGSKCQVRGVELYPGRFQRLAPKFCLQIELYPKKVKNNLESNNEYPVTKGTH